MKKWRHDEKTGKAFPGSHGARRADGESQWAAIVAIAGKIFSPRRSATAPCDALLMPEIHRVCLASPAQVVPLFMALVAPIVADGGLTSHRMLDGRLLVALDGTEHHGLEAIHCPARATRTLANGKTQYDHTAVTPGDRRPWAGDGPALTTSPRWQAVVANLEFREGVTVACWIGLTGNSRRNAPIN